MAAPLTSTAFKAKRRNMARDAASLNNMRALYHVAAHRKLGCNPSWAPTRRLGNRGFTGSVNVVCDERMGWGVCVCVCVCVCVWVSECVCVCLQCTLLLCCCGCNDVRCSQGSKQEQHAITNNMGKLQVSAGLEWLTNQETEVIICRFQIPFLPDNTRMISIYVQI